MSMETPPKRRGRPPEGLGKKGEPDRIRDYPRLLFTMRPATKARLKAIAEYQDRSEWRVIEDSLAAYFEHLPPKDRRAVDALAKKAASLLE
jgi:hypothetical protein